ncbi:MAG: endonuclease/exonuclease/phosphatase family protein [Bacteroidales bacterium]
MKIEKPDFKFLKVRKLIHKVFSGLNILFALFLIFSCLSVHIDPEHFALPAFFGLAYPYLLLINIVFAVLWAVKLRPEAFISIAVIIAGYTNFSNYIRVLKPRNTKPGNILVMSYNLKLLNYYQTPGDRETDNKIMSLLKSTQPDILCLQELFISGDSELKNKEIIKALGGGYYSHIKLLGKGKNKFYGIGTYTRHRIAGKGEIVHPQSASLSIYTDIIIEGDTFRVFNNHLQSFRLKKTEKSFIEELFESENREAINEIMSISVSLKKGFIQRSVQAKELKKHINSSTYPVIVTGDFNDTPVSYSYRKIRKGLNDSFVTSGYGAGFTYRGNYPPNRIDYILYDDSLVSTNFEILRVKYSDHYPVMAWFRKAD